MKAKEKEERSAWQADPPCSFHLLPPRPLLPSVASPPPLPPSPPVTLTTFLFARFSPASQGPRRHNASQQLLTHAERQLLNPLLHPLWPATPPLLPAAFSSGPSSYSSSPSFSSEDRSPRGTAGQRLRGIFDADSWLVPRSIGVRLRRELRVA